MAHPYAPMGGSYDDRVVGMVVEEFLKLGWIVGTFNFRYDREIIPRQIQKISDLFKEVHMVRKATRVGPANLNSMITYPLLGFSFIT